jgi:hypothetical protein
VPLRAATTVGAFGIVLAIMAAIYSIYAKFILHQTVPGWTGLMVSMSFLSGINLLFLGIIGEYVGRIYEEIKSRPLYVVSSVAGRNADAESVSGEAQRLTVSAGKKAAF